MSELNIIKSKYKIICIGVMIFCITMVGCTRKKEKTAEDWTQDKIMANTVFSGENWGNSIVENKKNIFYIKSDGKIVRFNKQNKKKKVIVKLKENKEDEHIGSLTLYGSTLYYLYDNLLYQCDFNGQHKKLIVYGENIKNVPEEYAKYIYGVHMEHKQMYLLLQGGYVGRFNPKTNEIKIIAEDVDGDNYFYQGSLYYMNSYDFTIYKKNLKTMKRNKVRSPQTLQRLGISNGQINGIVKIQNKLYFSYSGDGVPSKLNLYCENGKDQEKMSENMKLQGMISDDDSVIYSFYSKNKPILKIYDIKTKQEKETKLPSDFFCIIQVVDGHLLYQTIKAGEIRDTYSKIKLR